MCDRFPWKFDVETSYKQFLRVTYHTIVPLTEELYLLIKPELELHCRLVHRNVTNRKIFKLAFAKIHIRPLQLGEVNIAKLQPVTQVVETPSPLSPIQCCIVL